MSKSTNTPAIGDNNTPRHLTSRQANTILDLHIKGLSSRQIATQIGCNHKTVINTVNKHKSILQAIDNTKELEPIKQKIIDSAVMTLIKSTMDKASDDKASVNGLAYSAKQIYDISRLERGLSTANHAHQVSFTSLDLLPKKSAT